MSVLQHEIISTSGTFGAVVGVPFIDTNKNRKSNIVLLHNGALTTGTPKWGGLEDDFPFETGDVSGSSHAFSGV